MKNFFQVAFRFFEPIWENKVVTLKQIVYFAFQYSFGVIFILFISQTTDALVNYDSAIFSSLLYEYCAYFGISFLGVFLTYTWWAAPNEMYRKTIQQKYIQDYVLFDSNYAEKHGTGKSIAILSKGIRMWGLLLGNISVYFVKICLSVGITLYLLSKIHFYFVIFFLFLLFFGGIIGLFLNFKTIKIRKNRILLDNIWSKNVVRIIMSKIEILQSKKMNLEISKLDELQDGKIFYNKKMSIYLVPFFIIGNFITVVMLFFVYFSFGSSYYEGEISLGFITALTGAFLMMNGVFVDFLDFIKNFGRDFSEVQNMWDFFDEAKVIQGYETGNTFKYKKGNIELKNLSYSYEGNNNVFENFSLEIQGGKITAFVGPSGGGKSTLVKLIAGYLRANAGAIEIDGQKLSETSLKSYYQNIGYLTQEPSVFDGTIRENLMYALDNVGGSLVDIQINQKGQAQNREKGKTQKREKWEAQNREKGQAQDLPLLENILKLSRCEFIYDLPKGLDTEIGERGIKLSGGQKQRLAIAKIFLKNPKIIILDEPTSALDSQSEKSITQAMHELFKERTVLVIAHRLQTVKYADEIIVIDQGKILERGNHESLITKKGYYSEMLELQSGF